MDKTILTIAGLAFVLAVSGCTGSTSSIDPATLLEERCGSCHSTDIAKTARKSRSDWDESVTRMIAKGARLSAEEKRALISFLSKRYKP